MNTFRALVVERDAMEAMLDHMAVLADPLRCRMLLVLERHEVTVSELCSVLQLPQSTVSRHLKTLADAAWVSSRRDGTSRYYSASIDELDTGARSLWALIRERVTSTTGAAQDHRRLESVLARRRSKSEEFFSSASGQWDRLRGELFGQSFHLHALLRLLDPQLVVADLGCGTGRLSELVAPHVRRVIAVDASREMLDEARRRLMLGTVDLRLGTLEALPIDDGAVDVAMMGLVLHHVVDPGRALAECARVLKPGGRTLVIDMLPHDRVEYQQQMGHVWLGFPEPQMDKLLRGAGFTNISIRALPIDADAKGPALFAAIAAKSERRTKNE